MSKKREREEEKNETPLVRSLRRRAALREAAFIEEILNDPVNLERKMQLQGRGNEFEDYYHELEGRRAEIMKQYGQQEKEEK